MKALVITILIVSLAIAPLALSQTTSKPVQINFSAPLKWLQIEKEAGTSDVLLTFVNSAGKLETARLSKHQHYLLTWE